MNTEDALMRAVLLLNQYTQLTPYASIRAECREVMVVLTDISEAMHRPRRTITRRTITRTAPGICKVCGGEGEHDFEVHNAEFRASERNY